jgi:hypothetical protein
MLDQGHVIVAPMVKSLFSVTVMSPVFLQCKIFVTFEHSAGRLLPPNCMLYSVSQW